MPVLLVPKLSTYISLSSLHLAVAAAAQLPISQRLTTARQSPCLIKADLLKSCHERGEHFRDCLATACPSLSGVPPSEGQPEHITVEGSIVRNGWAGLATRDPGKCVLAVLEVQGWVHMHQIHDSLADVSGDCRSLLLPHSRSLEGPICFVVPILPPPSATSADLESLVGFVEAAVASWASPTSDATDEGGGFSSSNSSGTLFLLPHPDQSPAGLHAKMLSTGALVEHLPIIVESQFTPSEGIDVVFRAMHVWARALELAQEAGPSCKWVAKVDVTTYCNRDMLKQRLGCLDASDDFFLGATTAAYSAGLDPYMFPSEKSATILSRGYFRRARVWARSCAAQFVKEDPPPGAEGFFDDYAFALCLSDLGGVEASNYADIDSSFIMSDRPDQTIQDFWTHPDTVKQCLLTVARLPSPEAMVAVHKKVEWSMWHQSIPCIGETQQGFYSMTDQFGNKKPYYDERIRLAMYYCKSGEMLELERELSARLDGVDPRSGLGSLKEAPSSIPPSADNLKPERRPLCIFVPSSARKRHFVEAAEAAWRTWGTADTFFVSTTKLSPVLDNNTLVLDLDIDTDYAHLPVRTFRLFEALGSREEWVDRCDWYMKADADSFLNIPLILERLKCFNPDELWFLGVPQVAHSSGGSMTRFASGGAGYFLSRAVLPKVAAWAPFCLLQLLQHTGGTGMEDVSFAGCLWKWGRVGVVSYVDETEVITSEASHNRTRVKEEIAPDELPPMPPCSFVVHSVEATEMDLVKRNVKMAESRAFGVGSKPQCLPDAERLRAGHATLMAPEEGVPNAAVEEHQWLIYNDREFAALMACRDAHAAS